MNNDLHWPHNTPTFQAPANYKQVSTGLTKEQENQLTKLLYAGYPYNGFSLFQIVDQSEYLSEDDFDKLGEKIEEFAYKTSDKLQEFGDKGSAKVEEAWDKLGESGTVDDIKEAFISGTAKLMSLWDKLEKSGKLDDVKDAVEKVAKKATETAKDIAKEASDRAGIADEEFKADAEAAAEEEFKDEEI